jgi:ATP-dependent Clp protease ATP-binding subunit ClpA
VTIDVSLPARQWLASKGYDPVFGARPLRRLISESIKLPLSRLILFGALKTGGTARVSLSDDRLTIESAMHPVPLKLAGQPEVVPL